MPSKTDAPPMPLGLKPNHNNNTAMFQIFQNVQYNVVQHRKYVKEMKKLYKQLDENSFRESFQNALQYLFTFGDTSANVDRVVQFIATFCTSLNDEEEFLLFVFDVIFSCQCVSGQSVRYRASQLLAAILAALGDDASLDDDLCDKILASQKDRLQDTRGAVRCRAALALQRLQNPMDSGDDVTRAYRFHMSCDPSSSVRRAAVMSIAKCTRNVPYVLECLRDVDEAVRRAAFLHIAAISVTQLRVKQRVYTLKVGLTERSTRVRRVVEEILIPGWLSNFQGNIVLLLKAIRLDNAKDAQDSQYVAGKLLESLFKRLPVSELLEWLPLDDNLRLIPADKLNKETSWYWRHLAEHLQRIDDDETLEMVLPDLVVLTGYIKVIVQSPCPDESEDPAGYSTRQYVLHELGCLLKVYDTGDQAGRTALQELIQDVLTGDYGPLSPDVIRSFVYALESVMPDISARILLVNSVISSLRDPVEDVPVAPPVVQETTEVKMQKARLRVSLNVAMEAQEEAVKDQNYALAEECKAKVKEIQRQIEELFTTATQPVEVPVITAPKEKLSDAATLNKCLVILNTALDTPQLKTVTPMMKMILEELEADILSNPDVKLNALETFALYGMLDVEFTKRNKPFFFINLLVDQDNEPLVCCVLKCIVDLLCVHGAAVFEESTTLAKDHSHSTTANSTTAYSTTAHSATASNATALDTDDDASLLSISKSPLHTTVIEILLRNLDDPHATYRLISVEGLCRLMMLGHLESPTILTRLLLLWFNPATNDEDMLRQTIGVFFQTFASTVEGAQEQLQKCTVPTLRALAYAPSTSPLAAIDQEAVVRFIVSLTRLNHEVCDSVGGMALHLVTHLVRRPLSAEGALVCRALALLPPPRDRTLTTDLANMLREVVQKIPDKPSCRNLTRYLGSLEAIEKANINKMSTTGITEATMQSEDNTLRMSRATSSLPQPIARSTHVVINETVEEEPEIDDSSPTDAISRISEEQTHHLPTVSEVSTPRSSSGSNSEAAGSDRREGRTSKGSLKSPREADGDSSEGAPLKKAKGNKGKKKNLSINKISSGSESSSTRGRTKTVKDNANADKGEITKQKEPKAGGVKRTRSQRSLEDVERGVLTPSSGQPSSPRFDLDLSNVTIRRATRGPPPTNQRGNNNKGKPKKGSKPALPKKPSVESTRSTRSSASSVGSNSIFDDSADETELHTICYEQDMVQSLLNDSSELAESTHVTKTGNVTIPETPDASDESESEPEIMIRPKGKKNGKK